MAGGALAIVVGSLGLGLGWGSSNGGRSSGSPSAFSVSDSSAASSTPETLEQPAEFLALFVQALRSGDATLLLDRLDPAVITRYGEPACRASIHTLFDATASLTLLSTTGPATFAYSGDGKSVAVPDVYTFTVAGTLGGQSATRDFHLPLVDGRFHIFVDCGTPLPNAP